jgi:hypothetical protein
VSSRWQVEFTVVTFEGCALVWRVVLHDVSSSVMSSGMRYFVCCMRKSDALLVRKLDASVSHVQRARTVVSVRV